MKYRKQKRREVTSKLVKQHLAQMKAEQMLQSMDGQSEAKDCSSWQSEQECNSFVQRQSPSNSTSGYSTTSTSPPAISNDVTNRQAAEQEVESRDSEANLLIAELLKADSLLGIAEFYRIDEISGSEDTIAQVLCNIGDDIVHRLVQWIRRLPFCNTIPADLQSNILTSKWHEIMLLIMTSYSALSGHNLSYEQLYDRNIRKLQGYLRNTLNKTFSAEELHAEVGSVMEKVTRIMALFCTMRLSRQEYVCLQIILLLNHSKYK